MASAMWLKHAAEIWSADPSNAGPTGRFAAVIRGEIQDAGGNVLFEGTADQCVSRKSLYRVPVKFVPTEWKAIDGEVAGADNQWQLVTE